MAPSKQGFCHKLNRVLRIDYLEPYLSLVSCLVVTNLFQIYLTWMAPKAAHKLISFIEGVFPWVTS